ncbi:hypothetical protein M0R45_036647 [Rubus argutus]|uniref:Secreted protein n=1 Tax=Rubus argutus TaxID=59490 RepID=A0AAW1VZZ8_RUBAR
MKKMNMVFAVGLLWFIQCVFLPAIQLGTVCITGSSIHIGHSKPRVAVEGESMFVLEGSSVPEWPGLCTHHFRSETNQVRAAQPWFFRRLANQFQ